MSSSSKEGKLTGTQGDRARRAASVRCDREVFIKDDKSVSEDVRCDREVFRQDDESTCEDALRDDAGVDASESLVVHPSVVLEPSFLVRPFSTTLNFLSVFSTPIHSSPNMKPPHASAWAAMSAVLKHTKPRPKNWPSFGSRSHWTLRTPSAPKDAYWLRTTSSVSL